MLPRPQRFASELARVAMRAGNLRPACRQAGISEIQTAIDAPERQKSHSVRAGRIGHGSRPAGFARDPASLAFARSGLRFS